VTKESDESFELRRLNATFLEVAIHLGFIAFLAYWTYVLVRPFIPIMIWSLVLTVALYPAFTWLAALLGERRRLAAALITILGLLVLIGPATWLGLGMVEGVKAIVDKYLGPDFTIPPPSEAIKAWPVIGVQLYEYWALASTNLRSALGNVLPQLKPVGEVLLNAMSSAGTGTLEFLVSLIIAGFLFGPGPRFVASAKMLAHRVDDVRGEEFVKLAGATIRAVSRGVIGISLLEAAIAGIGMSLAGVPFASVLTLVILVLGIVQLGPILVIAPLVVWSWIEMSTGPAMGFTVCMGMVYFVEAFLKPFVLARGLTTPTAVIFIGVVGGLLAHGIPGLFAGPIILAVAWELANAWIYDGQSAAKA
jgi:predicted PurR-regulated permease PerM